MRSLVLLRLRRLQVHPSIYSASRAAGALALLLRHGGCFQPGMLHLELGNPAGHGRCIPAGSFERVELRTRFARALEGFRWWWCCSCSVEVDLMVRHHGLDLVLLSNPLVRLAEGGFVGWACEMSVTDFTATLARLSVSLGETTAILQRLAQGC